MIRPRPARIRETFWPLLLAILCGPLGAMAGGQPPPDATEEAPGQFFTIAEPITSDTIAHVRAAARQLVNASAGAEQGQRPILVFEFLPGDVAPGSSEFGACYDLANLISKDLAGARLTVAYVPQPLRGYAVLPVLACTEIVMASSSSLGPITPEGLPFDAAYRELVRFLALRKTRDPDLLLGMLDRDADLRLVRTADRTVHYVLAENLDAFQKAHQVIDERPAWDGGLRGVLTSARAREEGFCKRTADSPAELAALYRIAGQSAVDDPTLGQLIRPVWIYLEGPLDAVMVAHLTKRVEQARQEKANLLILQVNSPGGGDTVVDALGDLLSRIKDIKTVAYVEDRAVGLAALVPLACRDIVLTRSARLGDARGVIANRGGQPHDLTAGQVAGLSEKAALWARLRGHPEAVARAMVDPQVEVLEARDARTGGTRLIGRAELDQEPGRYQVLQVRKEAGSVLTLTGEEAASYGLGQVVADAEQLKALYGLRGREIAVEGPGWVDALVALLDRPVRELALAVRGGDDAGGGAEAAGDRPAGDHLGAGVPAVLLEPLPQRDGRPAGDHPVSDRAGVPGDGAVRGAGFRDLRDQRDPADAVQHRAGEPHVRLADARLRVSRAGRDAVAADGGAGGRGPGRGGAGAVFPVAAAVQPPDPQAGAVDAGGG